MKIEDIIYETIREIYNVEDKLRITTIFIACEMFGLEKLSELLYSDNHEKFIDELNSEYSGYKIDFSINFQNPNVRNAFYKTLEKVKKEWDSNGFLKAISEGDEFALAICDIVNYDFDRETIINKVKKIGTQLELFQSV